MSNLAYQHLAEVLADILERLIRLEQRLDSMQEKAHSTVEAEQAILR